MSMSADGLDAACSFGAAQAWSERIALLQAVAETGSISAAAKQVGLQLQGAWDVQALNSLFNGPLVAAQPGGRQGRAASITPRGHAVIDAFHKVDAEVG